VKAGEEYLIPHRVPHYGEVFAGTRTIHAFGGHRADRALEPNAQLSTPAQLSTLP